MNRSTRSSKCVVVVRKEYSSTHVNLHFICSMVHSTAIRHGPREEGGAGAGGAARMAGDSGPDASPWSGCVGPKEEEEVADAAVGGGRPRARGRRRGRSRARGSADWEGGGREEA